MIVRTVTLSGFGARSGDMRDSGTKLSVGQSWRSGASTKAASFSGSSRFLKGATRWMHPITPGLCSPGAASSY